MVEIRDVVEVCANMVVNGRPIKDWLKIPGAGFSAFWLGPLAEKNPIKTMELSGEIGKRTGIAFTFLAFIQIMYRMIMVLVALGWAGKTIAEDGLACVSYFPYVESTNAANGFFENLYFYPLQKLWRSNGKLVHWMLIHVNVDGYTFSKSVRLARRFKLKGERMDFLESFVGPKQLVVIFLAILFRWFLYLTLRSGIRRQLDVVLKFPRDRTLSAELIRRTFYGPEAVRGLFYCLAFSKAFGLMCSNAKCLYLAEMQSWEAALNGAAKKHRIQAIGYQHSAASRSRALVSHGESQMREMPLPDRLLCDGPDAVLRMKSFGYKNVRMVESIRNLWLAKIPPKVTLVTRRLLVAGTIMRDETESIMSILLEAIPGIEKWEILAKWHPSTPINTKDSRIRIVSGSISNILATCDVVLTGTSSVAAVAMAHGCDVILPTLNIASRLNILEGYESLYRNIQTKDDLIYALHWNEEHGMFRSYEKKRAFSRSFWCLDSNLPRWRRILEMEG